jgi:2-methylcitrate dehydratase PrpD
VEPVTQQLSAFARGITLGDIPADVQHQARRTLLNYFGCACGGARHDSVEAVIRGRGQWSGPPVATVIGRGELFDPTLAALLNGMSSAVYSFDDTHAEALVHPGGPVASSLLALAQTRPTTGSELLLSFIAGAEIVCRLSKSISTPPARVRNEWVQTGICAGIGAAAAAARFLDLPERKITSAIGIAASRASGLRGLSRSMCFSYMAGSAAESGVSSGLLAQAGMIGPDEPLAAESGFCGSFSAGPHLDYLTSNLGRSYELAANTFKPYPCGVVIHPVIDVALSLAERISDPAEIEQIVVEVHPSAEKLTNLPDPKDQFEAQVSMQHWTACAFLDRAAGVGQTNEANLRAPAVTAMRRRVGFNANPEMPRTGARVHVQLRSGETLSEVIEECRGSSRRPLSDAELEAKYLSQAVPALGEQSARRLATACWELELIPSVSALLQFATGTQAGT